ncbi:MAG: hypothetical protein KA327_12415, partial [Pseudarcicella sp.]|nr:hypothetical protein [Pseudarcicella sp.]
MIAQDFDQEIGSWKTHFDLTKTKKIVPVKNKLYCSAENGLFYYDTDNEKTKQFDILEGLSENGIANFAFHEATNQILIAYKSGNVDLIKLRANGDFNKIVPLSTLKNDLSIFENKSANHIIFQKNTAIIAYDFGLATIDIEKNTFTAIYKNIGKNGKMTKVSRTSILNDTLYLSTKEGIRYAAFPSQKNLLNFENWTNKTIPTEANGQNIYVEHFQNQMFCFVDKIGVFNLKNNQWEKIHSTSKNIHSIDNQINKLNWCDSTNIFTLNKNLEIEKKTHPSFTQLNDFIIFNETKFVADYKAGLMKENINNYDTLSPKNVINFFNKTTDQQITDLNGYLWTIKPGDKTKIIVSDKTKTRELNSSVENGALNGLAINTLAVDADGFIWIGTQEGIYSIDNAYEVLSNLQSVISATKPVYEGRNLFSKFNINSIVVDAGNRKWIGTDEGLYLLNPELNVLLEKFTPENAPLSSKIVKKIIIEPSSGLVYLQTPKETLSYRGTATEGKETQAESTVLVFPNPVKSNFTGIIGIKGLVNNATVKITDLAGNIVYQTQANGGTA